MRHAGLAALVALAAALFAAAPTAVRAVSRDVAKEARGAYEGRDFRLRFDLRSAAHAVEPNVLSLAGMGYGRESSRVLFYRLESVFLERVTSEGGARLSLTIYRNRDDARDLRVIAVPPPALDNPAASQTMASYARADSTTVILELAAQRKAPDAQRREITQLMERLFYIDGQPTTEEIESFVLDHRDWPVGRLATLTGLSPDAVRALVTGTPRAEE